MNSSVELNLGLILFLPWYAILVVVYCRSAPMQRRHSRYAFDAAALLVALVATTLSLHWSLAIADPTHGKMWGQAVRALTKRIALSILLIAGVAVGIVSGAIEPHDIGVQPSATAS